MLDSRFSHGLVRVSVLAMTTQESTQPNKQLLSAIFDSLGAGDTRPFTNAMSDDFRWGFAGEWSWARDWGQTKQDVRNNLLQPLMAQFAEYRASAEEIIGDGDRVVVRARAHARTTAGEDYPQAYCYVFRLRAGRLTEVLEYCDTALVERVLSLPGPGAAGG
jgi:uncharacterized protein